MSGQGERADARTSVRHEAEANVLPPLFPFLPPSAHSPLTRSPYSDHIDVVLPALGLRLAAVAISLPRSRLSTGRSTQTVRQPTHPQTGFAIVVSINNKQIRPHLPPTSSTTVAASEVEEGRDKGLFFHAEGEERDERATSWKLHRAQAALRIHPLFKILL